MGGGRNRDAGALSMATIGIHGNSIPAPVYLAGLRVAKANPDTIFKTTLWHWASGSGAEIMRQYRIDLHRRIGRRGGKPLRVSRVHPSFWHFLSDRRISLRPDMLRSFNRHLRARVSGRVREE